MRNLKTLAIAALLSLASTLASAQTSPNLVKGQVLTAGQWNALFAGKQDTLGYTPLNKAGDTMSGRLITAAPTTTAGLNLTCGTTPSAPVNGDMWCTTSGAFVQINGTTIGPLAGSGNFLGQQLTQGATTTSPGWYAQITGDANARVRVGLNATDVPSLAFGPGGASVRDTFIERAATANIRFGSPDAAAPIAQIISVQNVVAGTSNTVGAALTLAGSRGTGTGAGGDILVQVAPSGSSGTTQNALVTALHIFGADGGITIGSPTGGNKGVGTINAVNLYINGTAVTGGGGSGTVTTVSVTTANGISGTVTNATSTPAITLTLGAITPSTVAIGAGSAITSSGAGGALGSNAFTSTAYAPIAGPTFTGTTTIPALTLSGITGLTQCLQVNSSGVVAGSGGSCGGGGSVSPITSSSAQAFAVGQNGNTNPAFNVDASTASSITGLNIKSGSTGLGVSVSVISSSSTEALAINAKGTATINIGSVSTGNVNLGQSGGTVEIKGGLQVDGGAFVQDATTIKGTNTQMLAVGQNGGTNPAFQVDTSIASSVTGIKITSSSSGNGAELQLIGGGTNESLIIEAKGPTGSINLGYVAGANVTIGVSTIATSATHGFPYIPAAGGAPTGVPTSISGFVPMYIDTTNSQLWLYLGGAWKQPKTPAGAALVTWQ